MQNYPNGVTADDPVGTIGFITLINDNINKIPRDLVEVGPDQKQFRSSVEIFGRVTPEFTSTTAPSYNQAFYPNTSTVTSIPNTVIAIADQSDMFTSTVSATITDLYETKSNPLVARFSQITGNLIGGSGASGTYTYKLGVFETTPVESLLNIYFETSTTGLISSLNNAILTGNTGLATGLFNYTFSLNEGMALSSTVANQFAVQSAASAANNDSPVQTSNLSIVNITNGNNEIIQLSLIHI